MFLERKLQVEARCKEIIALAESKFGQALPHIDIRFDMRGRCAGQAISRPSRGNEGYYAVRFNVDMMLNDSWDHLYNNTIPHEIAHIVCFYLKLDRGHGRNWKRVCIQLGGNGERCHNEEINYSKGRTWYYVTKSGEVVALSDTRHRRVQSQGYRYQFKLGTVDRTCYFSLERPNT